MKHPKSYLIITKLTLQASPYSILLFVVSIIPNNKKTKSSL